VCAVLLLAAPAVASTAPSCGGRSPAPEGSIGPPGGRLAWRAGLLEPTAVYRGIPGAGGRRRGSIGPGAATWLLVLRAASNSRGRCWLKVRLPERPNDSAGWIDASRVLLRPTPWRLAISVAHRTLTVYRAGRAVRTFPVVVGARATPTPMGLFSIVHAWRGNPDEFVGAWTLGLTAHSKVLRHFEGGSGEIGIHGRGGASLLDPLGSAASHGCIRLANRAIEWLVGSIGTGGLPGVPVRVS
jgi:hypothetical protein